MLVDILVAHFAEKLDSLRELQPLRESFAMRGEEGQIVAENFQPMSNESVGPTALHFLNPQRTRRAPPPELFRRYSLQ
jgi:hypothetical protein